MALPPNLPPPALMALLRMQQMQGHPPMQGPPGMGPPPQGPPPGMAGPGPMGPPPMPMGPPPGPMGPPGPGMPPMGMPPMGMPPGMGPPGMPGMPPPMGMGMPPGMPPMPPMINPTQRGGGDELTGLLEAANNLLQQFVMKADGADERAEVVSHLQQKIVELLVSQSMGPVPPMRPQANNEEKSPLAGESDDFDIHSLPGNNSAHGNFPRLGII